MSESEFLTGEIARKHLLNAAPTVIETVKGPKGPGRPPIVPCDTYITGTCGMTVIPGPCDPNWVKKNPPPDDFVKKHGPQPWKTPRKQK